LTDSKKARKRHKELRQAISDQIEGWKKQFPEMTDEDVFKAMRTVIGALRSKISNARREAEFKEWKARHAQWEAERAQRPPSQPQLRQSQPEDERREEIRRNYERQREEQERQMQEREKQSEFGLAIIREGRKALARKFHPDVGGSTEEMTRLNRAADRLRSNV
jgi:hypothetical protein